MATRATKGALKSISMRPSAVWWVKVSRFCRAVCTRLMRRSLTRERLNCCRWGAEVGRESSHPTVIDGLEGGLMAIWRRISALLPSSNTTTWCCWRESEVRLLWRKARLLLWSWVSNWKSSCRDKWAQSDHTRRRHQPRLMARSLWIHYSRIASHQVPTHRRQYSPIT